MRESVKSVLDGENRMEQVISVLLAAPSPDQILYGYGPLGVGVVALTYGIIKLFNIVLSDRDKAMQQRDALVEDYFTKVLPAITKSTEVLQNRQDLDRELIAAFKESSTTLQENGKAIQEMSIILKLGRDNAQRGGT